MRKPSGWRKAPAPLSRTLDRSDAKKKLAGLRIQHATRVCNYVVMVALRSAWGLVAEALPLRGGRTGDEP
jgi:hypothetical protein